MTIIYHLAHDLGGEQAQRNSPTGVNTAPYKIQVADAVTKIGVAHKRRHFAVGAGAVKSAQVGASLGLNHRRRHHPFFLDEGFDVFSEDVIDFSDGALSGLLLEQLPILARITGRVDHDKPVLTTFGGIAGYEVTGFVDVNRRVVVHRTLSHGGKLRRIIFAEEDIVAVQFRKLSLDAPVKNQGRSRLLLLQDALRLFLPGQQLPVGKKHIHIADDLVVGICLLADA